MKSRPHFLSPLSQKPPLPPISQTIRKLCLRFHLTKPFRKPRVFTFERYEILMSKPIDQQSPSTFIANYRYFPSPRVRLLYSRELARRLSQRV